MIQDPTTDRVIGDSFDIAVYLDKTYPDGPPLFPSSSIGLHKAFNVQFEAMRTPFLRLSLKRIPFNPETAEQAKSDVLWRIGKASWEEALVRGEERVRMAAELKDKLGELANFYLRDDGVFLDGQMIIYADLIDGGWLQFLKATLEEWEDMLTWHDGRWRKIHEALEKYAEVK
jgi:glutathione S-transferase